MQYVSNPKSFAFSSLKLETLIQADKLTPRLRNSLHSLSEKPDIRTLLGFAILLIFLYYYVLNVKQNRGLTVSLKPSLK